MIIIQNFDAEKFTYNSLPYFKNYTPIINGEYVGVVNTNDRGICLIAFKHFSEYEVDGSTYSSVEELSCALIDVIFDKDYSDNGGTAVWGTITGNIECQKDLMDLINNLINSTIFSFSLTPNLIDNTEEDYTIPVAGVLASNNYNLFSNTDNGISVTLSSWSDGNVTITVRNNTGEIYNSQIDFVLKEV